MYELIFLIAGLLGLIVGAYFVVKASVAIAQHYKISQFFIGLTILAVGTDLPELVIIIKGGFYRLAGTETSGLMVGEILGSCFGQIALVLGILGLFGTLILTKRELKRDGLMLMVSVLLLFLVGFDGIITRFEGLIFIIIYLIYFYTIFREEKVKEKVKRAPPINMRWVALFLIIGFAFLIYSSDIVVANGIKLAVAWGLSQATIGILIIGLGTSLPEIAVSIGALFKGAFKLSVGNLIGSNIFDVLFVLGVGSTIAGFNISQNLLKFDIPFLFLTSLFVVFLFAVRKKIKRKEAVVLIGIYGAYAALKIIGF